VEDPFCPSSKGSLLPIRHRVNSPRLTIVQKAGRSIMLSNFPTVLISFRMAFLFGDRTSKLNGQTLEDLLQLEVHEVCVHSIACH
jgi:hypothetical protein